MEALFSDPPPPPPSGLVLQPEALSVPEEQALLAQFEKLRWDPIVIRGQTARRTAHHYGLTYDYDSRSPRKGEPFPGWLVSVQTAAAELAGVDPGQLVQALVQRYPPGAAIGWHRDAPAFGIVVGISLLAPVRLRLRRGQVRNWEVWEAELPSRSGYVLAGAARWSWQHSIPPVNQLRYSVTFRSLRQGGPGSASA